MLPLHHGTHKFPGLKFQNSNHLISKKMILIGGGEMYYSFSVDVVFRPFFVFPIGIVVLLLSVSFFLLFSFLLCQTPWPK